MIGETTPGRAAKGYSDFFSTSDPVWWRTINEKTGASTWNIRHPGADHHGQLSTEHHVEEHEDGTISVQPQPGNSNSILCITCGWHGYIERGVWREC